jgi:uncharacterized protein YqjF (DUF2071 family)
MLNYEIDPALLRSRVPVGTELDYWNGKTFISIVGFRFLETRLLGWRVPFHTSFDEVNLRFYVRYKSGGDWHRGVVFLKEIAPRAAVVLVARWVYNEQYVRLPMRSQVNLPADTNGHLGSVNYSWKWARRWNELSADISGPSMPLEPGSQAEFIAEHYWGYSIQRNGSTLGYRVDHPPWRIWHANQHRLDCDVATLYGIDFARVIQSSASSAFVADGSEVSVYSGRPMQTPSVGLAGMAAEKLLTQPGKIPQSRDCLNTDPEGASRYDSTAAAVSGRSHVG